MDNKTKTRTQSRKWLLSPLIVSMAFALSPSDAVAQQVFADGGAWYRAGSVVNTSSAPVNKMVVRFKYDGPALQNTPNYMWGVSSLTRNGNEYTLVIDAPSWKANGFGPGEKANFGINLDGQNLPYDITASASGGSQDQGSSDSNSDQGGSTDNGGSTNSGTDTGSNTGDNGNTGTDTDNSGSTDSGADQGNSGGTPTPGQIGQEIVTTKDGVTVTLKLMAEHDWGNNQHDSILIIDNKSGNALDHWIVSCGGLSANALSWNANVSGNSVTPKPWNETLAKGQTLKLQLITQGSFPTSCALTSDHGSSDDQSAADNNDDNAANNDDQATDNDQNSDDQGDSNADQNQDDSNANDTGDDADQNDDQSDSGATDDSGAAGSDTGPSHTKRVVGYFPAWGIYGRNYQVTDIPAEKLTHINYAFINIGYENGHYVCKLGDPWADTDRVFTEKPDVLPPMSWTTTPADQRGNFGRLNQLKEKYPHLKTLISIGGWTWSKDFSNAALTVASRDAFVDSCVDLMKQYNFDGIDVDWEYPVAGGLGSNTYRPVDKQNYTLLMKAFRAKLDTLSAQTDRKYLLTIAAPAGYDKLANIEIKQLVDQLDFVNMMTYDFRGSWENTTGHHSGLFLNPNNPAGQYDQYYTDRAIQIMLDAGVPANKIVVGVPFYARSWKVANCNNHGLYQPSSGGAQGPYEPGMFDYRHFLPAIKGGQLTVHVDDQAMGATACGGGVFHSFDNTQTMRTKVEYVNNNSLGGIMFWELSGDVRDPDSNDSLLKTIDQHLK